MGKRLDLSLEPTGDPPSLRNTQLSSNFDHPGTQTICSWRSQSCLWSPQWLEGCLWKNGNPRPPWVAANLMVPWSIGRSGHGINVILNARVVRISHCETKVSIQLENGHCHEADHCICTLVTLWSRFVRSKPYRFSWLVSELIFHQYHQRFIF